MCNTPKKFDNIRIFAFSIFFKQNTLISNSTKTAKKKIQEITIKDGYWDISKEIYLKHGSRKRLRKNINNKKTVSKEKEKQYELKLDF